MIGPLAGTPPYVMSNTFLRDGLRGVRPPRNGPMWAYNGRLWACTGLLQARNGLL